jgi:hypothetical protein
MRKSVCLGVLLAAGSAVSALAFVGSGHMLFGDADYVSPGLSGNRAVKLVADPAGDSQFSGVDFGVPAGLTVADLDSLGTQYFFPTGSSCGVGSPRFQIKVDHDSNPATASRNIFVYIGPPPSYTGCPPNVVSNTGNLLEDTDLVDSSQIGGTFYDPWANVVANFGSLSVTGIQIVSDLSGGPQTVIVDNTDVDGTIHDYEFTSKEDCKKGGWKNFSTTPGPFKNQGQCVSHFARQK